MSKKYMILAIAVTLAQALPSLANKTYIDVKNGLYYDYNPDNNTIRRYGRPGSDATFNVVPGGSYGGNIPMEREDDRFNYIDKIDREIWGDDYDL